MRLASAAAATGMAGVLLAAVPAMAAAENSPALHTVSVQGAGTAPISPTANEAAAVAAYRAAMAAAVADALSKAQFLAAQVGTTVDTAASPGIQEGAGYLSCPSEVEYTGERPDFGTSSGPVFAAAPVAAGTARPTVVHRKRHKRHTAKKAVASSCTVSAGLSITYVLN